METEGRCVPTFGFVWRAERLEQHSTAAYLPSHSRQDVLRLSCSASHPRLDVLRLSCFTADRYAEAMVLLLDPDRTYFGDRIVAQGQSTNGGGGGGASLHSSTNATENIGNNSQLKRLIAGLEGREPIVIILDDSSAVWPHDLRNLFVVRTK